MATNVPPLPEGYEPADDQEITQAAPVSSAVPPLPEGYEPAQEMPGIIEAGLQGARAGWVTGLGQTADTFQGQQPQAPSQVSPAAEPFGMEDLTSPLSSGLPKVAYKLSEASPTIAGGLAGAGIGGAFTGGNPAAIFTGGVIGSGVGAAAQTLGPIFAQELAQGVDPDLAYERAYKSALASGAFSGAGWALWPVKFFQGPVKQAVFQLAGVQPGLMVGERAAHNVIADRPAGEDLGTAFTEGLVLGTVPAIGHAGVRVGANIGRRFFEPKNPIETPITPDMLEGLPPLPEGYELEPAPPRDQGMLPEDPSELPQPPPVPRPGSVEEALIMTGPRDDWSDAGAYGEGPAGRETGFRLRKGQPPFPPEFPGVDPVNTPFAPQQMMQLPFRDAFIAKYLEWKQYFSDSEEYGPVMEGASRTALPGEVVDGMTRRSLDRQSASQPPKGIRLEKDPPVDADNLNVQAPRVVQERAGQVIPTDFGEAATYSRAIKELERFIEWGTKPPRSLAEAEIASARQRLEDLKAKRLEIARRPSPLQMMRMAIEGPERPSEDNTSFGRSHIDDVFEAGAIVRPHLDMSLKDQLVTSAREAEFLDALDSSIPRYVYDDPNDRRVLTGFDIEQDLALRGNDPNKPKIYQISSMEIDPTKITADLYDLPTDFTDKRVKIPGLEPEMIDNLMNYPPMQDLVSKYMWAATQRTVNPKLASQYYNELLDAGVRVAPSRGAGFIYGGKIRPIGDPLTDAPPSTRSHMYFTKTPEGYVGDSPAFGGNLQIFKPARPGRSIDWAKVPEGAFVSIDPMQIDRMIVPKGKEAIAQNLKDLLTNEHLSSDPTYRQTIAGEIRKAAKAAHKEGVYIPFKHSVLATFEPSLKILQVAPIPETAFTIGYTHVGQAGRSWEGWQRYGVAAKTEDVAYVPRPYDLATPEQKAHAKEVFDIVKEVRPFLDQLVKRFGGKAEYQISVLEGINESPGIYPDGRIIMPAEFFFETQDPNTGFVQPTMIAGDLKAQVLEVLKHELGHAITLKTFDALPRSVQSMIQKAYYRALLDYEIRQDLSTMETVFKDTNYQWHHITFAEWMAEQFRRWTHTDRMVFSDMDRYFRDGAQSLQDLHRYFVDKYGLEHAKQKFTSTWAFNEWMDYLEYAARDGKSILELRRNSQKLETEYPIPLDVKDAFAAVQDALRQFGKLVPEGTQIQIEPKAGIQDGGLVFGGFDRKANVIRLMVGSLAWLKTNADMGPIAQRVVAHEAWHSVEDSLSPAQLSLLNEAALRDNVLPQEMARAYYRSALKQYKEAGLEGPELQQAIKDYMAREYRAHLMDQRANGKSFGSRVDAILDAIIQFIERVGNMVRGKGFTTAEDLIRAFYSGELTRRKNEKQRIQSVVERLARSEQAMVRPVEGLEPLPGKPDTFVAFEEGERVFGKESPYRDYFAYDAQGNKIARLMTNIRDGEYYIEMIELLDRKRARDNIPKALIDYAEQFQGYPFRAAQEFTQAGYKWVQRHYPEKVKYYVWDERSKFWFSPKFIWEQVEYYENLKRTTDDPQLKRANFGHWKSLAEQIPKEALEDRITLDKQWMMRDFEMSSLEKERQVKMGQMAKGVTGDPMGLPIESGFDEIVRLRQMDELDKAQAREPNLPPAPPEPEQLMMWNIGNKFKGSDPAVRDLLQGSTKTAADRLSWFGKRFLSIRQLAWRNPHIEGLRNYIMLRDQENSTANNWIYRAQDTAKEWEKLSSGQSAKLTDLLYWASEMEYLSSQERAQGVVRQPTLSEIQQKARLLKLDPEGVKLYARITKDMWDYLGELEGELAARIRRETSDPAKAKVMLDSLKADMDLIRARPDFPMMRFGEYTLTGRDPTTGEISWFSAYGSAKEREADIRRVHQKFNGAIDLRISKVPEFATEFMGLPKPLLDRIVNDLPMTSQQREWVKRFAKIDLRDQRVRARSTERRNTPGYSLDGLRTYAFYFRNAARYLAQTKYQDQIANVIRGLEQSAVLTMDSDKRSQIVQMVKEHDDFVKAPGKEWNNLKAFVTHFQLGASVAAAAVNLTQVPMVAMPYLSSLFSQSAVKKLVANMGAAGRHTWDYTSPTTNKEFLIAREEVIRQGKIDTGQAAELGTFAESQRFDKLRLGSAPQKFWRNFAWLNMYLFQHAEKFNREWVFKAAYDLAMAEPRNKHVLELSDARGAEKLDIMARTGLSEEAANALLVAREAIDRTQGVYQQWDRPKFLRPAKGFGGQVLPAMQIFFSFTQQTMFQLFNNPGSMKMLMMIGLLAGMSGLPGAEDLDNALRLIARKIFGKDFSLLHFTRERMNELAKGTIFEPVAADLFLNGISRYGFGLSLASDAYAPQFDASASMSFGQLVPGATPLLRGLSNAGSDKNAWKEISGELLKDVSGPAGGPLFALLQYMSSPPYSSEAKKWEMLLPRMAKGVSKAYRYASEGAETSSTGAKIAKFDWYDPSDRATIIAQALGFTPRKLSEGYEAFAEASSREQFYKARKLDVLIQFDRYAQSRDPEQLRLAREAVLSFNNSMRQEGRPELQIGKEIIQTSIKNRARARAMTERQLPNQKRMIPSYQDVRSQWPGLIIEEKKVK